jgi:hypothetical protein
MAYTFGATTLPVANVARDSALDPTEQIGDPALTTILSWASAVLTADLSAAWLNLAPNETLIRTTSPHDPREEDFATSRLPALFAYREDGKAVCSDGEWSEERPVTLLWAFPPAQSLRQWPRRGASTAIGRSLIRALGLWNGRHPSWVVVGDSDPFAAQYGSSILTWGGFKTLTVGAIRNAVVQVGDAKFDGVSVELLASEEIAQTADGFGVNTITATINQTSTAGEVGFVQSLTTASPPTSSFSGEFDPAEFL